MTTNDPQASTSAPPKPYVLNHEDGVDVLELHDYNGDRHLFLNMVCQGTSFQIVSHLGQAAGVPSSRRCTQVFYTGAGLAGPDGRS